MSTASADCSYDEITFELGLMTDHWGADTSSNMTGMFSGSIVATMGNDKYDSNAYYLTYRCLPRSLYHVTMSDSYGDGLAGGGSYTSTIDGKLVKSSGSLVPEKSYAVNVTVPMPYL